MKNLLAILSKIGCYPTDDDFVVVKKQFLVYQGIGMSFGGLLWGTLLFVFDYPLPSIIPYGYTLITILNFYFLWKLKNFNTARIVQMSISVLLPFLLQWFLGGFNVSGGVMLWSLLALVSSATYLNLRDIYITLVIFVGLILFSLILDPFFEKNYNMGVGEYVSLVFLVVNILSVSLIVFFLMLYFNRMNQSHLIELRKSYTKLINSEKLAALGQISAGVAHEINTPLGAIKSSSEESLRGFKELTEVLPKLLRQLPNEEEKDQLMMFMISFTPELKFLTTKEEREIKRALSIELDELGVEQARFVAERLVKVGVYKVNDAIRTFCNKPYFPDVVTVLYDLLNQQKNNNTIQVAVEKASRIVQALKTYLHTNSSEEKESINLANNIDVVLTIYQNRLKQGIEIVKDYEEIPEILGYSDQLSQVWTNLIINAVQAMDGKGRLTIGIKKIEGFVRVSIKDNGCGIPENIRSKIFDTFFTTKISGEGSGLGLDIIKRILKDHGGKIYFDSEVNKGTSFYVELPLSNDEHE